MTTAVNVDAAAAILSHPESCLSSPSLSTLLSSLLLGNDDDVDDDNVASFVILCELVTALGLVVACLLFVSSDRLVGCIRRFVHLYRIGNRRRHHREDDEELPIQEEKTELRHVTVLHDTTEQREHGYLSDEYDHQIYHPPA